MNVSLQEAALLLQEVAKIASNELKYDGDRRPKTEILSKPPELVELSSNDVSDSSESLYPEDRRFRTIRSSSSNANPVPTAVVTAGLLVPSPMQPPFSLATPTVHTVSPTPRAILSSSSQPPILPIKPVSQTTTILHHCKHVAPSTAEAVPTMKSKYVGTSTPNKVKGLLKRKFSWKNYPDVSTSEL